MPLEFILEGHRYRVYEDGALEYKFNDWGEYCKGISIQKMRVYATEKNTGGYLRTIYTDFLSHYDKLVKDAGPKHAVEVF